MLKRILGARKDQRLQEMLALANVMGVLNCTPCDTSGHSPMRNFGKMHLLPEKPTKEFSVSIRRLCQSVALEPNLIANLPPRPPLLFPVEHGRDRTQTLLVDLRFALRGRQVE